MERIAIPPGYFVIPVYAGVLQIMSVWRIYEDQIYKKCRAVGMITFMSMDLRNIYRRKRSRNLSALPATVISGSAAMALFLSILLTKQI